MRAGFYESDITPAIGMERPGSYVKRYITAIGERLNVRAAVFESGGVRIAVAGLDTAGIRSHQTAWAIRKEVETRCGIPASNVLVAASHTHSGGAFIGFLPEEYENAPEPVRRLMRDHSVCADPLYHEWVIRQTATAICEADRRKQPATLSAGSGHEDQVSFNRRFNMKNGRTFTHPGKMNPDIVEPAGPTDPEVAVIAAWTPEGELLGCIVNYACHGTAISFDGTATGDWITRMVRTVQGAMHTDVPVVFLNGAAGDITQIDNVSSEEQRFGDKWARFVGARVGAEVIKVLVSAEKSAWAGANDREPTDGDSNTGSERGDVTIAAATETLQIERRGPSEERIQRSREIVARGLQNGFADSPNGRPGPEWVLAKEIVIAGYLKQRSPILPVEVQALQIGAAIILANPTELVCELGLRIKRESRFPLTCVVELANGRAGYVPGRDAFGPEGGGYETLITAYSNLAIDAGERIVAKSLELSGRFSPDLLPEPPKAPEATASEAGAPWRFGCRPPETE